METQKKINVGILGASGRVGQTFVEMLSTHTFFNVSHLGGSVRTVGKTYEEAVNFQLSQNCYNTHIPYLTILPCETNAFQDCKIIFSALDSSVAGPIEEDFANNGFYVFSNARNHRMDTDVPILLPHVNSEQIELIKQQPYYKNSKGFIITNANCSSIGLCVALAPIYQKYGIKEVSICTLQALSGAGYPGVPSTDILDNVIPYIKDEEEKLEIEPNKILGQFANSQINFAKFKSSAVCHRVAVQDGHLLSVSVKLADCPTGDVVKSVTETISNFKPNMSVQNCPSCPSEVIHVFKTQKDRPQPRLDRDLGNGMTVSVGRIRPCSLMDIKFTIVSNNIIIGAAGCSILNAEFAYSKGFILA